jgi:hypothetical protein
MGRYIEWDDVINRYPELNTLGGADELSSSYIVYSEAFVDGALANYYTIPFSNNNMMVRDLSIDYVYWRAARFKFDDAAMVKSSFFEMLELIKEGNLIMITDSGEVVPQAKKNIGIHSSTQSYHSAFGMNCPEEWHIDENNVLADSERD